MDKARLELVYCPLAVHLSSIAGIPRLFMLGLKAQYRPQAWYLQTPEQPGVSHSHARISNAITVIYI